MCQRSVDAEPNRGGKGDIGDEFRIAKPNGCWARGPGVGNAGLINISRLEAGWVGSGDLGTDLEIEGQTQALVFVAFAGEFIHQVRSELDLFTAPYRGEALGN